MDSVAHDHPDVSPSVTAALLLAAHASLRRLDLPRPSVAQILDATGAKRSRAYQLKDALLALLPNLVRPVGRPRTASTPSPSMETSRLSQKVLRFVVEHPGSLCGGAQRHRTSVTFRRFVLELCEQHREIDLATISDSICVPLGTLKDWLRGGQEKTDGALPTTTTTVTKTDPITSGRLEMIIEQWRRWEGNFVAFCDHISINLRIPYGRTLIKSILELNGERAPRRRPGRSPDEKALRGAFETFFPGAQWVGDGTPVDVQIGEQRFGFNLELMIDAYSAANVGISTRDEEDGEAVIEAFDDGVQTTGAPPLCTLLDNRPSNHSPEIDEGLGTTMRMRATKGRAQNKAHAEGAFGLFFQVMPLLAITATNPKEMARQLLQIAVTTWARTLNHRPRKDRKGCSRVELYATEAPTSDQIKQARTALQERCKQQEKARETLRARQDPFVRDIIDNAFSLLTLDDPEGNTRSAIARYPLDAIVNGIATFKGKRDARTLPDGVDARYLLGIVKNISAKDEGLKIMEAMLQARLEARDRLLFPLQQTLDSVLQLEVDPLATLKTLADLALKAERQIDRIFWLGAIADHIRGQPGFRHTALLRLVSKRIHATFAVSSRDRQVAVRFICSRVIPFA